MSFASQAAHVPRRIRAGNRRVERRAAHRAPCRVAAMNQPNAGVELPGKTVNVSAAGIAVQIGAEVPPGTRVAVEFLHPDGSPTEIVGEVIHARRVATGIYEHGIRTAPPVAPPDPAAAAPRTR